MLRRVFIGASRFYGVFKLKVFEQFNKELKIKLVFRTHLKGIIFDDVIKYV